MTKSDFTNPPSLKHLKRLTTPTGLIQHADHDVPDPAHGYSIDDNARALIVCVWHYQLYDDPSILRLADIYLRYIERVFDKSGDFHNFLSYSERLLDTVGSDDSNARAVWALGVVVGGLPESELATRAQVILDQVNIERHLHHDFSRAKAYILLGLIAAGRFSDAKKWADRLVEMYTANADDKWQWFENGLYYANAIIPYALAKAAQTLNDKKIKQVAEDTFNWLDQTCRDNNFPSPIGQNGWYKRGSEKAIYDQQPLEAADMALAAIELFELTKDKKYHQIAEEWFDWYHGRNLQKLSMYNADTDGIYDGLTPNGVNKNQGAESIVTYLLSYLELARIQA